MSATGRGTERQSADFYATPAWCMRRLLEAWRPRGGALLEPCAGDGRIIRAARASEIDGTWTAIELRGECALPIHRSGAGRVLVGNFLTDRFAEVRPAAFDAIITNPPFSRAMEFVERSLPLAAEVAMLLRLNFWASGERQAFFRTHPADTFVLPNRPAFVNGKTDSCEYAWFVWPGASAPRRAAGRIQVLNTTSAAERRHDAEEAAAFTAALAA